MTRHRIAFLFIISLAALTAFCTFVGASQQPNIIFILADDMGYGDVGFNGQKKIQTPHLDRLAADGVNMTSFYSGSPVCGPSRATLMYGQHTGHCPIRRNPAWTKSGKVPQLGVGDLILPKVLKQAGYQTAVFGKWALNDDLKSNIGHPLKQGFDEFYGFNTHGEAHWHWPSFVWDGEKKVWLDRGEKNGNWNNKHDYADDLFHEKAIDYIERKAGEGPFFAYINYTIPHKGFSVPAKSREPYESLGWEPLSKNRDYYRNDPDVHTAFAGMISHFDAYVGDIRATLEAQGIAENTLIIFTSDNGHEMKSDFFDSNGIFKGGKRDLYEGGVRMPTAIAWPSKIQPGSVIDQPFAFWDVLPTLAEVAGAPPAESVDGISFLPSLLGQDSEQTHHEYLYWEFGEKNGPMQSVRFGKWKAIRFWNMDTSDFDAPQLYDLDQDPGEAMDLAANRPEVVSRALKYITGARTEHPEFPLAFVPKASHK